MTSINTPQKRNFKLLSLTQNLNSEWGKAPKLDQFFRRKILSKGDYSQIKDWVSNHVVFKAWLPVQTTRRNKPTTSLSYKYYHQNRIES